MCQIQIDYYFNQSNVKFGIKPKKLDSYEMLSQFEIAF